MTTHLFTITLIAILFINNSYAQNVGIGTTSPTAKLDVNGTARIRTLPIGDSTDQMLVVGPLGNVKKRKINFFVSDYQTITATTNFDHIIGPNATRNNLNTGLSLTVTVAPYTTADVLLNYSVPMGLFNGVPRTGYMGIRALRGGVEIPQGSRKTSVFSEGHGVNYFMTTINSSFSDVVINNTGTPMVVTYQLDGYYENNDNNESKTLRINMWSGPPALNYNWGYATFSCYTFTK